MPGWPAWPSARRGLAIWLAIAAAVVGVLSAIPHPGGWPIAIVLALAVSFVAYCLADIARAESVRGLPK
jgi:membrane protein implicated in regulation of membrane protease activity